MRRRPSPALVVAFLALLVSASGVTFAAIPARDGDVHACYDKKTGQIELKNTQRDRFTCPKKWAGLTIDTTPGQLIRPGVSITTTTPPQVEATNTASRLVSPNGEFKIEATNTGARMTGPKGAITVSDSKVAVLGDVPVEVTANTKVSVTGGAEVDVSGGRALSMTGADMNLNASANLMLNGGSTATLQGLNELKLSSRRTLIEGLVDTRIVTKDLALIASGVVDLNGTPVRINGETQTGN